MKDETTKSEAEREECEGIRTRLTAWLDGECIEAEARQIETHLADCSDCAIRRDELIGLAQIADAWQVEERDVWPALFAQIGPSQVAALTQELRQMRAEMALLKAEVAALHARLAERTPPATHPPAPLMPYSYAVSSRTLHIV